MTRVRHVRKTNATLKTRLGVVEVDGQGWVIDQDQYDTEALLQLPHFEDGEAYPPRGGMVDVASEAPVSMDEKYLKVLRNLYADKDAYTPSGNVLLGTCNDAFGKAGLPMIKSNKLNQLRGMISEELACITEMAMSVNDVQEECANDVQEECANDVQEECANDVQEEPAFYESDEEIIRRGDASLSDSE